MRVRLYRYLHQATDPHRTRLTWFDLIEIGLVALGFVLYFLVRGGVVERTGDALANARWIISLQRSAKIFFEPALNEWARADAIRVDFFNFVYFWLDFPLIIAVGLFFFWRFRRSYTLLRDSLLISGAFALVLYFLYPVAPPRYMAEWGFVDTIYEFSQVSYQAQSMQPFVNPFAAVPSLHVGWAALLTIVIFVTTRNRWIRTAAVAVLIAQVLAVMATANHYFFDAVVGLVISLLALAVATWLQRTGYPRLRDWFGDRAHHVDRQGVATGG